MKLKLVLIPVNSPEKGADDVKAKLNEKFLDFYDGLTRSAYSMTGTELNSTLPVELARRQMEAMKTLTGDNRAKAEKNLLHSAAMLKRHPLRQAEIMDLIHECFGHKASVIKQAVEQARVDLFNGSNSHEWKKPAPRAANTSDDAKGKSPELALPDKLPLPCDSYTTFTQTACILYQLLVAKGEYYRQGRCVCFVSKTGESYKLEPVTPDDLRSRSEKLGATLTRPYRVMGQLRERQSNMKQDEAKVLLTAQESNVLSNVRGLVSFPVLTANGNDPIVHLDGYNAASEILVKPKQEFPPLPTVPEAVATLEKLLKDFQFKTPADKARAFAMLLTMALSTGRVMQELLPMFFIEADQSATGKGLLVDIMAAIYNQNISYVAKHEGRGAGGQDESFYAALDKGSPLVMLDNWRGKLDSTALESFMTCRSGLFDIRLPYSPPRGVDPRYYMLALTSNGVELTTDQSNRTILIRLRKQPAGYKFPEFPEGDILEHVRVQWKTYLAAIYALAAEWIKQGRQETKVSNNGFSGWTRPMDWIVQNLFKLPPLLEGMEDEKIRFTSPALTFLRQLAIAVAKSKRLGEALTASNLVDVAFENGIQIPGLHKEGDDKAAFIAVGMSMGRAFGKHDAVTTDNYVVTRSKKPTARKTGPGTFPVNTYNFTATGEDSISASKDAPTPPADPIIDEAVA